MNASNLSQIGDETYGVTTTTVRIAGLDVPVRKLSDDDQRKRLEEGFSLF